MSAVAVLALLACAAGAEPVRLGGPTAEPVTATPTGWAAEPGALRPATRSRVLREAEGALRRAPRPVAVLASAGSLDPADPRVVASREAFEDADDAVILALAWRETGEARFRDACVGRLVAWAREHQPTGHPVDEARLDGLVHAWLLLGPALPREDAAVVRGWLKTMRDRKRAWEFGPRTTVNNHRTHQLRMLLLLDRALGDDLAFVADRAAAEQHAAANLDAATGESVDLRERDALYYHAYNLDAWLEIAVDSGCCRAPVTAAYQLLERRIQTGELDGEFQASQAALDGARAHAGYGYGGAGSTFDPARAEHAILTFYTGPDARDNPFEVVPAKVQRRNLYALARYESWTR